MRRFASKAVPTALVILVVACSSRDQQTDRASESGEPRAASSQDDRTVLQRYDLTHIGTIGAETCDQIMATNLCMLAESPRSVQEASAKDIALLWKSWQRRLEADSPAALEQDCREVLPIVRETWLRLPYGEECHSRTGRKNDGA